MDLSIKQVRRLALAQQGLLKKQSFGKGINAVEKAINRLHYLQIDTISVVERAHHHILRSRVADFQPAMLTELSGKRRAVFEYWFHAAAYLPIADYRFCLPVMRGYGKRKPIDKKIRTEIIHRIKAEGPLQARDFAAPDGHKSGGWWSWKPAKLALEYLFLSGELMVSERRGFQKVYELTENVLPADIDTTLPGDSERGRFYVQRMLAALGPAQARDIAFPRATIKRFSSYDIQSCINQALQELIAAGEVCEFSLHETVYYCLSTQLTRPPERSPVKRVTFLSPFDNLLINRRRLLELFEFNYQLECYLPATKRTYGYFSLPILYGDAFIGRMDCKAERSNGNLLIKNIWLEEKVGLDACLEEAFVKALSLYRDDLGCQTIQFENRKSSALIKFLYREIHSCQ